MSILFGKGSAFGNSTDLGYVADAEQILNEVAQTGINVPFLIKGASALVFVKTTKVAFWGKVEGGSGIMIAKKQTPTGPVWTAPCCLTMLGAGGGFSWGVSKFYSLFVINDPNPVPVFQAMQAQAGVEVDLKIANKSSPIGQMKFGAHSVQVINISKGIMLDLSLAGSILQVDDDSNMQIYGRHVTVPELVDGQVPPPQGFAPLANRLYQYLSQAA